MERMGLGRMTYAGLVASLRWLKMCNVSVKSYMNFLRKGKGE